MPFIAGSTGPLDQRFGPTLRRTRLLMSAARQISPIDEGASARSDNDAESPERSLNHSESAGLESSPAVRRHLPDERRALTHHFPIAGQEGYLTVGVYEDGLPGEIFITMAKQGSTISGLMDAFATMVSLALQYGVPLRVICDKLCHMRFEPSGWSGNPKIGYAKSLMDYIARWLELRFLAGDQGELFKALPMPIPPARDANGSDPVGALGELMFSCPGVTLRPRLASPRGFSPGSEILCFGREKMPKNSSNSATQTPISKNSDLLLSRPSSCRLSAGFCCRRALSKAARKASRQFPLPVSSGAGSSWAISASAVVGAVFSFLFVSSVGMVGCLP